METKKNYGEAIISVDILGINGTEMRQMSELNNRIVDVLDSHKPEAKEKKYISDNDLKLMHAVLSVFTKEYTNAAKSEFDNFLALEAKKDEKPVPANDPFFGKMND